MGPRLPFVGSMLTCVLGAISWVLCFGGFALFASAGLGLAYVSLNERVKLGRGYTLRYMLRGILLFTIVATVCSIANMRMAAIISSSGIVCLSFTMFYRTAASVPAVRDQKEEVLLGSF